MHIEVYSRRWGHTDKYTVTRTASGWRVSHLSIGGDGDKQGAPALFENLDHDSINYPQELGGYMEWLWDHSEGMSEEDLQSHLDELGQWIQATEKASPGGLWDEYK